MSRDARTGRISRRHGRVSIPTARDEQAALAYGRLRPQAPIAAHVAPFGPDDVSIACLRDGAVDPVWQVRAGREHLGRVLELDAGHSPFLTQPAELAALLASLCEVAPPDAASTPAAEDPNQIEEEVDEVEVEGESADDGALLDRLARPRRRAARSASASARRTP